MQSEQIEVGPSSEYLYAVEITVSGVGVFEAFAEMYLESQTGMNAVTLGVSGEGLSGGEVQ